MKQKMKIKKSFSLQWILVVVALLFSLEGCGQAGHSRIVPGAERTQEYLPLLRNSNVAVVANPASRMGGQHLVDSLLALGVKVKKIFSPEHGFRGKADAGEKVKSGIDSQTGLPIVSLYGKHKKPYDVDLQGIDQVVFDLQDVGARFYTYISTLHYVMEACAENDIPVLVLDRPNPNAFYIDGPVLKPEYSSFVGMHPVPVVYGMSIGEYAQMINGEGWLKDGIQCELTVIPCGNWNHQKDYALPIKPSPNLPNATSVILYPSLCFFEGTVVSAGRGTDFPFQCFGHPGMRNTSFSYTPRSIEGASKYPKFKGEKCFGYDLRKNETERIRSRRRLNLSYLIGAYHSMENREKFFNPFFEKLAGTGELRKQIQKGMSEQEIRKSWQADLKKFKSIRKKYLLYSDSNQN
jgi:uncharacterized protein YbbC (DUF1343 family)